MYKSFADTVAASVEVFLVLRAVVTVVGWEYPRLAVVLLRGCMGCCRDSLGYATPLIYEL
jgi:hypothetical protein